MLPINEKTGLIEFNPFMRQLEAKYKFDHRDMANRFKKQLRLCKKHGLNFAEWYNKQFTKMNETELMVKDMIDAIPYQDVWHWLLDNDFEDFEKGGGNFLDLSEKRLAEEMPDYVHKVLRILRDELNANGVTEEKVEFYVDW